MNNYKKSKILFSVILIILTLSNMVFAVESEIQNQNEIANSNEQSDGNIVRQLTLQEQANQVKDQLAQANEELEYVQGEISDTLIRIQNLEDEIATYQVDFDTINNQYQDLKNRVDEAEAKLETIQNEYEKKDNLLKQRLVIMYKQGTTNYLDVLFSSRDIIEFVSNYFIIQTIAKYDSEILEDVNKKKLEIEKTTRQLEEDKANMKLKRQQVQIKTTLLENTKTALELEKTSLNESEQKLLADINTYKAQQAEINNLIQYSISASTYNLQYSGGIMLWPTLTSSYITSPFGSRLHPIQGIVKNHAGIDIGGVIGNPIYAAADGVIIYSAYNNGGYGNMVMIDHGFDENGVKIVTLYGHGNKLLKNVGDEVVKGEVIMEMGSTGNSTGPHLHFEVRENGVPVDPKKYLSGS